MRGGRGEGQGMTQSGDWTRGRRPAPDSSYTHSPSWGTEGKGMRGGAGNDTERGLDAREEAGSRQLIHPLSQLGNIGGGGGLRGVEREGE